MPSIRNSNEAGSSLKHCAHGVMPWARQVKARIQRRRHFELSAKNFTTTTWDNDCRMGGVPFTLRYRLSGAGMTNETMKALLMILIIGGLQAAIHIPKIWTSQRRAFLV